MERRHKVTPLSTTPSQLLYRLRSNRSHSFTCSNVHKFTISLFLLKSNDNNANQSTFIIIWIHMWISFTILTWCFWYSLYSKAHGLALKSKDKDASLATTGYCNCKHASRDLNRHEISQSRIACTMKMVARKRATGQADKNFKRRQDYEKSFSGKGY